ncbi:polyketide cyclase [Thermomonas sp.]|uniref:polyketide cyclase n=1 Tax=Thermomonas sp. TaxID=1971895 RepID=UPI001D829289|nr:polyketide cyclase [Thermomonas sp.]MBZ0087898.1 polyketide cyclase [Thermomonas sp.]MCO5056012.1 polyketide cyclase [Thermomonas sp.]HRO62963.1 polyketide cyclase [Thermomonas sp.]
MTRVLEILISLAIVAGLYLALGIVLPSSRHLSERIETNRKLTIVYDTVNSFRRFKDWNAVALRDPRMQLTLSGPEEGVGAKINYSSQEKNIGAGSWEIVQSQPNKMVGIRIQDETRGENKRTAYFLRPTGRNNRNVEVIQTYDVDYGWNIFGRYAGLYVTRHMGEDMKLSLSRLVSVLATVPNIDYRVQGSGMTPPKVVDRPEEDVLYVSAGAIERGNAQIQTAINNDSEWIKRVIEANGLEAVGPVRIVTTELGQSTYTFDVMQVVRRKDGSAVGRVTIPAGAPVKYEHHVAGGRAVTTSFTGYMAGLENVRNALRAWAATHGYEIKDRAYEDYNSGVAGAFTENGKFDVYWPIK